MSYETASALTSELEALLALAKQPAPAVPPQSAPATLIEQAEHAVAPFLEQAEGDRLKAYQDSSGHWTIGIGHTGPEVHAGMVITRDQELMMFAHDLMSFAQGIYPFITLIPTVGQYAALISLAYNIGVFAFKTSKSVLAKHNAGDFQGAAAGFLLWDKEHKDGVLVENAGLLARRQREAAMYLKGSPNV